MLKKVASRQNRHRRVRKKVRGTSTRPRLAVYRSNRHIYAQLVDGEGKNRRLHLRAIDECQSLFGSETVRRETSLAEGGGGTQPLPAFGEDVALAHEDQRDVTEGGKVATGPDAALLGYHGDQTAVHQVPQRMEEFRADPARRA